MADEKNTIAKWPYKKPDLGRCEALAGKIVYDCHENIHYDLDGYVEWTKNPEHELFKGTTESVRHQPKEDALAGKPWTEDWTGLIYWNFGEPWAEPLTAENQAEAQKLYWDEIARQDREKKEKKFGKRVE